MTRHLPLLVATLSLASCTCVSLPSTDTEVPSVAYAGKKCPVSTADISAAVTAARQSKDYSHQPIFFVHVINRNQIDVMYGSEVGGFFITVKRVHGRWQPEPELGGWNA